MYSSVHFLLWDDVSSVTWVVNQCFHCWRAFGFRQPWKKSRSGPCAAKKTKKTKLRIVSTMCGDTSFVNMPASSNPQPKPTNRVTVMSPLAISSCLLKNLTPSPLSDFSLVCRLHCETMIDTNTTQLKRLMRITGSSSPIQKAIPVGVKQRCMYESLNPTLLASITMIRGVTVL